MEFKIEKRGISDLEKVDPERLKISRKFAVKLHNELGDFLKEVVVFGSSTKTTEGHDIDILVIIDDCTMVLGKEVAQTYRVLVEQIISETSLKLHVTTLRLTSFWEYIRVGDPIAMNMLRGGFALIDTGFWEPLKTLLYMGRIRPTSESIWTYFMRAPNALRSSEGNLTKAFLDLYWAVIDSAHAAIMAHGEIPPTPEHVPEMLLKLVKKKLIPTDSPIVAKEFYVIMKKLEHRKMKSISGVEVDKYTKKANKFVESMRNYVKHKKL